MQGLELLLRVTYEFLRKASSSDSLRSVWFIFLYGLGVLRNVRVWGFTEGL